MNRLAPPPLCDSPIHREGERGKGCSVKGKTSWEKGLEEEGVGELHGLLSLATRQVKKNIPLKRIIFVCRLNSILLCNFYKASKDKLLKKTYSLFLIFRNIFFLIFRGILHSL